jgi:hypothetical protein
LSRKRASLNFEKEKEKKTRRRRRRRRNLGLGLPPSPLHAVVDGREVLQIAVALFINRRFISLKFGRKKKRKKSLKRNKKSVEVLKMMDDYELYDVRKEDRRGSGRKGVWTNKTRQKRNCSARNHGCHGYVHEKSSKKIKGKMKEFGRFYVDYTENGVLFLDSSKKGTGLIAKGDF